MESSVNGAARPRGGGPPRCKAEGVGVKCARGAAADVLAGWTGSCYTAGLMIAN